MENETNLEKLLALVEAELPELTPAEVYANETAGIHHIGPTDVQEIRKSANFIAYQTAKAAAKPVSAEIIDGLIGEVLPLVMKALKL